MPLQRYLASKGITVSQAMVFMCKQLDAGKVTFAPTAAGGYSADRATIRFNLGDADPDSALLLPLTLHARRVFHRCLEV